MGIDQLGARLAQFTIAVEYGYRGSRNAGMAKEVVGSKQ